jgi:hypothetical protein
VLAIAATGVFAGSAQAVVVDNDDVVLNSVGYDYGGSTWVGPNPSGAAEIHFHHENGQIRAHTTGTLHLNDADGTCARIRLRYYDIFGTQLSENFGGQVCVFDDLHHQWSVNLDPFVDDSVARVEIAVMKEEATGEFVATSASYWVNTHSDDVLINAAGRDFGSGSVSWVLDTDGNVRAHLTGSIHINNSSGDCIRMNIEYQTSSGGYIDERPGGTVCAASNAHRSWSVNLDPFESDQVGQVKIELQTLTVAGTYVNAGSQTVSLAE